MFDRTLIQKCQKNGPRYTSYPTADRFHPDINGTNQVTRLTNFSINHLTSNNGQAQGISLYLHIPFCNTLCLFCGCNKIITNDKTKIGHYLDYLEREIAAYYAIIGKKLHVVQLHFGGGSPSWMSLDDLAQVMAIVKRYFNLDSAKEIAMEVDPRHTTDEFIQHLKQHGFNRLSLGVQDLELSVQKAVNRVQPLELNLNVLTAANKYGFKSTNIDLIYGLPKQTLESFTATIDTVINLMHPARIALFNYAHIPSLFMPQTRIKEEDLPDANTKLDMLQMSVEKLTSHGYVFIGMDHFALPTDELAIALEDGSLHRNFQGYSTLAGTDMLSFGVSAIGCIDNCYYQNVKDINEYYRLIDGDELPVFRGVKLTTDDVIRSYIIQEIMCKFKLDFNQVAQHFNIDFSDYFTHEIKQLTELHDLGLIELHADGFIVNPRGRFLIRNVAMVFDKYLQQSSSHNKHSKVI